MGLVTLGQGRLQVSLGSVRLGWVMLGLEQAHWFAVKGPLRLGWGGLGWVRLG